MTANVRPSWIDVSVDGRANDIGTGPRSRDGNMDATVYVREDGSIHRALNIEAIASADKKTVLLRVVAEGVVVFEKRYTQ